MSLSMLLPDHSQEGGRVHGESAFTFAVIFLPYTRYSQGMVQSKPQNSLGNTHLDAVTGRGVGEGVRESGGKVAGSLKRPKGTRPQPKMVSIAEEEEDSGGESRRAKRAKMAVKVAMQKGQDEKTKQGQGITQRQLRSRAGQSSTETEAPLDKSPPITGKRKRATTKPKYVYAID
jgi:hypothetical protein